MSILTYRLDGVCSVGGAEQVAHEGDDLVDLLGEVHRPLKVLDHTALAGNLLWGFDADTGEYHSEEDC